MVLFLQKSNDSLQESCSELRKTNVQMREIRSAYETTRRLQLSIQIFNMIYSRSIFYLKIITLTVSTMYSSLGVLLFNQKPLVASIIMWIGVSYGLNYTITFEKGFALPRGINKLKQRVVQRAKTIKSQEVPTIPAVCRTGGLHKRLLLLRWIYAVFKCIRVLFDRRYFSLKEFPTTVTFAAGFAASSTIMFNMFIKSPISIVLTFNQLFEVEDIIKPNKRNLTIQEYVAVAFPYICLIIPFATIVSLLVDPFTTTCLYSSVPASVQNSLTLIIVVLVETLLSILAILSTIIPITTIILFFQKSNETIQASIAELSQRYISIKKIRAAYMFARRLQLSIQLFNRAYADIIFIMKVISLNNSILFISFSILMFHKLRVLATVGIILGSLYILVYTVAFEKAFAIPRGTNKLRKRIVQMGKRIHPNEYNYVSTQKRPNPYWS
ncbi:unnamed protein product [Allacma fusca]|uniref:Uncharacterized protein n=1 Tax=Allacma fusca TaxID=39272 RepID=A0A8J2KZ99_9HEXA|nr:unnamed protein product [Allacma fusca]